MTRVTRVKKLEGVAKQRSKVNRAGFYDFDPLRCLWVEAGGRVLLPSPEHLEDLKREGAGCLFHSDHGSKVYIGIQRGDI